MTRRDRIFPPFRKYTNNVNNRSQSTLNLCIFAQFKVFKDEDSFELLQVQLQVWFLVYNSITFYFIAPCIFLFSFFPTYPWRCTYWRCSDNEEHFSDQNSISICLSIYLSIYLSISHDAHIYTFCYLWEFVAYIMMLYLLLCTNMHSTHLNEWRMVSIILLNLYMKH